MLNTEWAQVEVIELINDGSGLAFGIIGGKSTGVVVKTILPGGVADRDGRLQSGDHILQIGEVNLRGLGSEQVASVLRQCGIYVRMVVARPVDSTTVDIQALGSHAPIVPTKILSDPVELDRHLLEHGYEGACLPMPREHYVPIPYNLQNSISDIVEVVRDPLPIGRIPIIPKICPPPPPLSPLSIDSPETETFTIELKKDDLGLGITVAGYVCEKELSGIFVKSINKGSAADATKIIKVNDRIVEVNETSMVNFTNHQAVEYLKHSGPMVKIKFERYLRGPKYEQLQQAIKADELRAPSPTSLTITSLPKVPFSLVHMSHLGIEPEGESRTSIDFDSAVLFEPIDEEKEIVLDDRKITDFELKSQEVIYEKWRCRLNKNVEILIAQIHKPQDSGLGISLEGTVDVEDGQEVRPHHYIRNILPDGPVGLNGVLQSGDELLEVNGTQLLGLNHLEVVTFLKQLPAVVNLVCARYPVPIRIIDTAQHPDAFQARKILAGSLQTLLNSPDAVRLVKAKSESSIVSSLGSETLSRSKSMEFFNGIPMWCEEPTIVELNKGDHGLGFSILDYQDPLNPEEILLVIRSLVPGGVAQADGRLIPGDRLLGVNDISLNGATLETAVQVLKNTPKGPVKLAVAKPLRGGDAMSHVSQETEDDQTCLEDFQECIEEFQEDLLTLPIFIEDEYSFNHSPSTSQLENYSKKCILDNNYLNLKPFNKNISVDESDLEISFKSSSENCVKLVLKQVSLSEKDGYETCIEESLSEDNAKVQNNNEVIIPPSSSEPCLPTEFYPYSKNVCLNFTSNDHCEDDEFFLVQYPTCLKKEVCKSLSEPLNLETKDPPGKKLTYKLREYYNDYEECLVEKITSYEKLESTEMSDSQIFNSISLPFKSHSTPDVMDRSFVTLVYDPGPEQCRRKSAFVSGYAVENDMTVIRYVEPDFGNSMKDAENKALQKHWGSTHTVRVYREQKQGLGISIVGGKVDVQPSETQSDAFLGIFVKCITPGSPAAKTGQFKVGDRILEVSGIDLRQATHEKAVKAIKDASNPVVFLVQSLVPWRDTNDIQNNNLDNDGSFNHQLYNHDDNDNVSNKETTNTSPRIAAATPNLSKSSNQKPFSVADESSDDEEDETALEGRTVSAGGQQIDRASAANVRRSKEEIAADQEKEDEFGYTTNKVKKKYGNLGHNILMVQLERSSAGLGLSLAGHRDRSCMAVFVCGLNPNGAAFKTGSIQIGDEILEVNGVVLHGRCHLNASAIIKSLTGPVFKVIVLRRKAAIDDIAVKPITQFPVSLAEETSEEHFSANYPNVRTVAIKKPSGHSLGIMIIEGKHAEVGQGIFISDIQEGSSAEKAGLEIGEMILAVNKDSLIGSSYDTAANLLKRTEGLVTLIVSKPGKKDQSGTLSATPSDNSVGDAKGAGKPGLKTPTTPSRPTTPVPEPPADPLTCPIIPGRETTIEITTNNDILGIAFIGGKDTVITDAIILTEVYKGGAADKDGRLQPGDQILEVNGTSLKNSTNTSASLALRQTLPKMKIIVLRPNNLEFTPLEVDFVKKPGKGIGLSISSRQSGKGVYVADIIAGTPAELDGRIAKGDILITVNGQNIENATSEEAGAILKTATGKISLKLHRYKPCSGN
ncbi:inaD-like protein isoform X2 [Anthonomus grandis grandis]|uniref:inaD-like protein isoform X2 n=1 Tax=Anthonomus grandis grandis TaxID=2921223 RepID=UPI0021660CB6|nr:inaD-like protein isoform X2 [Anthonomus grandis grandis]